MTTDITELAQREKFEAWAEEAGALPWGILKKHRNQDGSYPGPHYTYMWKAWQAASAELVEALEKAQRRIAELENYAEAEAVGADRAAEDSVYWMKRCKELESRTVKLPEPFDLAGLSGGLSYYYADEVDAALTAQGIKVEAE